MTTLLRSLLLFMCLSSSAMANIPKGMTMLGTGEVLYLGLIKVYDARLYADTATSDNILDDNVSRCLSLNYVVAVKATDFIRAAEITLARQHTPEAIAAVRNELDILHQAYHNVERGDTYSLCYHAEQRRTSLSLNGRNLVSIDSAEFARLYFGIWLSDKEPIDDGLRRDLLAGTAVQVRR